MHDRLEAMVDRMCAIPERARSRVERLDWPLPTASRPTEQAGTEREPADEVPDGPSCPIQVVRHSGAWGVAVGSEGVDRHFPTQSAALGLALDLCDRTGRPVVIDGARSSLLDRAGSSRRAVHVVPHGRGWGLRLGDSRLPDRLFADRSAALREAKSWGASEHRRVVVQPADEK